MRSRRGRGNRAATGHHLHDADGEQPADDKAGHERDRPEFPAEPDEDGAGGGDEHAAERARKRHRPHARDAVGARHPREGRTENDRGDTLPDDRKRRTDESADQADQRGRLHRTVVQANGTDVGDPGGGRTRKHEPNGSRARHGGPRPALGAERQRDRGAPDERHRPEFPAEAVEHLLGGDEHHPGDQPGGRHGREPSEHCRRGHSDERPAVDGRAVRRQQAVCQQSDQRGGDDNAQSEVDGQKPGERRTGGHRENRRRVGGVGDRRPGVPPPESGVGLQPGDVAYTRDQREGSEPDHWRRNEFDGAGGTECGRNEQYCRGDGQRKVSDSTDGGWHTCLCTHSHWVSHSP